MNGLCVCVVADVFTCVYTHVVFWLFQFMCKLCCTLYMNVCVIGVAMCGCAFHVWFISEARFAFTFKMCACVCELRYWMGVKCFIVVFLLISSSMDVCIRCVCVCLMLRCVQLPCCVIPCRLCVLLKLFEILWMLSSMYVRFTCNVCLCFCVLILYWICCW